jgi:16S rRNA (adenine1518-N6/adenine1519-N6)-dimethyltransferase
MMLSVVNVLSDISGYNRLIRVSIRFISGGKRRPPPRPSKLFNDREDLNIDGVVIDKNRPFTLPPGMFKPKQSLGQNFLSDQNYVNKIVQAFIPISEGNGGSRVVEIGSGTGALTRVLLPLYPNMTAVDVDPRGVEFLKTKLPTLNCIHGDVLDMDWCALAAKNRGPLNIIGNLPYNVTSQILFNLVDNHRCIDKVVITSQWEFAERVLAKPSTKAYGIPSVVFQLYCSPVLNFKLPPTVFFPVPKVDSALITMDFTRPLHPTRVFEVSPRHLRRVLAFSFRMRRKMLRHSLKELLAEVNAGSGKGQVFLSERWETKRPEQLYPLDFVDLTKEIYGDATGPGVDASLGLGLGGRIEPESEESTIAVNYYTAPAWRSTSSKGGRTVDLSVDDVYAASGLLDQ